MPIRRQPTPADAKRAFDLLRAEGGSALFLFFGAEDPATGASWCPDCVTADPVLRSACAAQRPDLVLHECPVGQRSEWKNQPGHPYRLDPDFRIARIPTLLLIEGGCEAGRLVEGDCAKPGLVAAFLAGPAARR
jgi:thiol-disulfide isomerase/thioredoxin